MHHTQLSLRQWFMAMYLDAQVQERGRCSGATWYVLCRLRIAVNQREEQYLLNGEVDVVDMFVGGVSPQTTRMLNPPGPLPHCGESR